MKHARERLTPRVVLPSLDEVEQTSSAPSTSLPSASGSRPRHTRTLGQFYEQTRATQSSSHPSLPRVDLGLSEETGPELSPLPSSVKGPQTPIEASVLVDPHALLGFVRSNVYSAPTAKPLTPKETIPLSVIPSPLGKTTVELEALPPRHQDGSPQKSKPTIPLPTIPSPLGKITREFETTTAQTQSEPSPLDPPLGAVAATDLLAPDVFDLPNEQPQPQISQLLDSPSVPEPHTHPNHLTRPSQPLSPISRPIARPSYPRQSKPIYRPPSRTQGWVQKGKHFASNTVDFIMSGTRMLLQPITARNLRAHIAKLESADRIVVEQFLNIKERVLSELGKQQDARTDIPVTFAQYVHALSPTEVFLQPTSEKDKALASLSELLNTVVYFKEGKTPGRFVGYRTDGTASTFSLQIGENNELVCSTELPNKQTVDVFLASPADDTCVELTRLASGIRQPGQREPRFSFYPSFTQTKLLQTIATQIAEISSYTPQHTTQQGQQNLQQIFFTAMSNAYNENFPVATPAKLQNHTTWPAIETDVIGSTTHARHTFEAYFALEQDTLKIDSFLPSSQEAPEQENLFFTISENNTIAVTKATDEVSQTFPNLYAAARNRALQLLSALTSRTRPDPYYERSPLSLDTIDQLDEVLRRLQSFVLAYKPDGTPYAPSAEQFQSQDSPNQLLFQQTYA